MQMLNTHIDLKKNIENISYILHNKNVITEDYNVQYGEGYRDKNGKDKFSEVYTTIEDNITYIIVLITDKETRDNIVFNVFQMENDKLNKKFKIINDFILNKLKNKYSKEFNAIKNDNKKYNIKIKIYVRTNNYLKIFITIEKNEFT